MDEKGEGNKEEGSREGNNVSKTLNLEHLFLEMKGKYKIFLLDYLILPSSLGPLVVTFSVAIGQ